MGYSLPTRENATIDFAWNEVSGAIGDSVTVLPILVAVTALTDLSVALVLVWFGVAQVVWGLHYGVPVSVEPMKAVAALVVAGTISTGEYLVAGLLLGVVLLAIGRTHSLERVSRYVGTPVVRGIQLGVALVLLRTGVELGVADPLLAGVAVVVTLLVAMAGDWRLGAVAVFLLGAAVAGLQTGAPSPSLPALYGMPQVGLGSFTLATLEATVAQLAMTLGNAALATAILLGDYFNKDVSADDLSTSMGATNLVAIPLGGMPMCHGSGGVAGKYAFGARTAGANVILGVGYVLLAVLAADLVTAYPLPMLGILLAFVAGQMARTSLQHTEDYLPVLGIGVLGLVANLGVAFVVGIVVVSLRRRLEAT